MKKTVVLVDDNTIFLKLGEKILSEDYIVVTAWSAVKLFEVLESVKPAVIILDVYMPKMDGFETLEILKANPATKDIPVIFLTGIVEPKEESKGRSLGAVDYITKPFNPKELVASIERATAGEKASQSEEDQHPEEEQQP